MSLTPIPTEYNGHIFRSRTEARWAVFFDVLQLKYEYEVEGFILNDGTYYLPDFKVTTPQGEDMWVEVKPSNTVSDKKFNSFRETITVNDEVDGYYEPRTSLVSGDPYAYFGFDVDPTGTAYPCPRCGWIDTHLSLPDEFDCYHCDMETPCGGGHPKEIGVSGQVMWYSKGVTFTTGSSWCRTVKNAAKTARSARFEHGEKPQIKQTENTLKKTLFSAVEVGEKALQLLTSDLEPKTINYLLHQLARSAGFRTTSQIVDLAMSLEQIKS